MLASVDPTHDLSNYSGDVVDPTATPIKESGWQVLDFADPAECFVFFNDNFSLQSANRLYKWQTELLEAMANVKPDSMAPLKICLRAANGSGKDSIIIAAFCVWFILSKIQARVIITSSSGTQLTGQTETSIRNLCESVNKMFGVEYIRVRQRYYKCRLSGSEIRLFATDEAGKAEGYHPIVPGAEMAIVISEGKTVTDLIHQALRRCTGYNYWLEVSTPGEPIGYFYKIASSWLDTELNNILDTITKPGVYSLRVTSYDCPRHLSLVDIEEDKLELGEHSAFFRSKHLALFTSLGGEVVIPAELVESLFNNPPKYSIIGWETRIGLDLAAGGDENCVSFIKGNKFLKEVFFREFDTTITADRIEHILEENLIPKNHPHIYADDGGIGHSIIDMLKRKGWNIKRVLNQWAAINKKQYGNRGAENWYRCKRLFEENLLDITNLSQKTKEQIGSRRYKQGLTGARIILERKSEAKANGRPSPDRADAFMLALTGLTVDAFLKAKTSETKELKVNEGEQVMANNDEYEQYYRENVTYGTFNGINVNRVRGTGKRIFNSLRNAMKRGAPRI
jgi:phage terminase large subunit